MYSKQGDVVIWDCIQNIDNGKDACPKSKALRENIVQKAFVDAYNLLCNAKDLNLDELLNNISEAIKNNSNKDKIRNLKKNINDIELKEKRLLDLLINETITDIEFKSKKESLLNKKEKIEHKIEQYTLLDEDNNKIDMGIDKIRKAIDLNIILSNFDDDVFEALIDYVIIGGYVDGQEDNSMIRFICKSDYKSVNKPDLISDDFVQNSNIIDGSSQDFIPILDFYSNQLFYIFKKDENGKLRKIPMDRIRVRLELKK